jgi:hypothetical protein
MAQGNESKKAPPITKAHFEWAAKEIVGNRTFYENRPSWDSVIEFARAMFRQFGQNYDDEKFIHRLKELYESD